ncbi:unnamed protein product [Brachionus calyciflorus]|uniref:Uncharacterized protein n=1 Tax=Brachionus calyciflorus TaxID=104777 RepID=A0A813QNJ7_9BILA|nr:unnamed protein product [Brachionus calyciflorus]
MNKLEPELFSGLDNLKYLDLQNNCLATLDKDLFEKWKNLVCLNLSNCGAKKIDVKYLNELKKLEYLNLTCHEVNISIDYENINLPNLKYLAISAKAIPNFKSLQLSYLRVEKLHRFDQKILVNQKKLKGLCLEMSNKLYNRLEKNHFSQLRTLVYLEIRYLPSENLENPDHRKDEVVFLNLRKTLFSNRQISIENFAVIFK